MSAILGVSLVEININKSALKNILVNVPIIERNQGDFTNYEFTVGSNIMICYFKNDLSDRVLIQVIAPQTSIEELNHLKNVESNYIKMAEGYFYKPATGDQKEINVVVQVDTATRRLFFQYSYD